jgi:two-component system sensor histidine kinase KdpD
VPRDIAVLGASLASAYYASDILLNHTGVENNSALVFTLAVVLVSFLTTGYVYGVLASVIGAFFTNYYFMAPYAEFSLSRVGYPVATLSMLLISIMVCALTARVKSQKEEAIRREQNTKRLYELNEKLSEEKTAIQLQSERERIRGNILRAVSHDLRTPLTTISGSASVLMSAPEVSEYNFTMLEDIKNEADAMIQMVENLLSVTRIQDGALPLNKWEEMLEEVAGDAVIATRRRFPGAQVDMELSEDLLFFPMDPVLIKQVIVNLLENAIRHGGEGVKVCLRLSRRENWAVLEVMDRGVGLPEYVIRAVREGRPVPRDQTGDSTRGMGIGLSVCGSIIKAHNGTFEADNRPEGGAVFRVSLPMNEDTEVNNHE